MLRTATGFSEVDVQAIAYYNNVYSGMSNITFPSNPNFPPGFGGNSLIVAPGGRILAQQKGGQEAIVEAELNIGELRKDRRIPRYPMEVVKPVFDQFVQEVPIDILDVPRDELPQSREKMKELMDQKSRWLNLQGDAG